MKKTISRIEFVQALAALCVAIGLQITSMRLNRETIFGPHIAVVVLELIMATLIAFNLAIPALLKRGWYQLPALVLLVCISGANIGSLGLVLDSLIVKHTTFGGVALLSSAIAIFLTNIIVYALWYWEIDSPGFTRTTWTHNDKDFQFTQQDMHAEYPTWHPQFIDYLYLSLTNAVNFAPADARPLSRVAKLLMGSQSLISVFTLALVVARSVSILGS